MKTGTNAFHTRNRSCVWLENGKSKKKIYIVIRNHRRFRRNFRLSNQNWAPNGALPTHLTTSSGGGTDKHLHKRNK